MHVKDGRDGFSVYAGGGLGAHPAAGVLKATYHDRFPTSRFLVHWIQFGIALHHLSTTRSKPMRRYSRAPARLQQEPDRNAVSGIRRGNAKF